jgi:Tfp pilus assembly ATPase PilU
MRKAVSFLVLLGLAAIPALAAVETYKDVSVVDVNCSTKVAADPDSHTRACALKCAASGFGIVTKDKQFLKFDAEGNTKIADALKASDKKDHLRVDVSGDVQGDTLKVTSIKLL